MTLEIEKIKKIKVTKAYGPHFNIGCHSPFSLTKQILPNLAERCFAWQCIKTKDVLQLKSCNIFQTLFMGLLNQHVHQVMCQFSEYCRTRQDLAHAELFFTPFSFNYLDISRVCTCHTLQTGWCVQDRELLIFYIEPMIKKNMTFENQMIHNICCFILLRQSLSLLVCSYFWCTNKQDCSVEVTQ